jgi:hypothetical protein
LKKLDRASYADNKHPGACDGSGVLDGDCGDVVGVRDIVGVRVTVRVGVTDLVAVLLVELDLVAVLLVESDFVGVELADAGERDTVRVGLADTADGDADGVAAMLI